jgi:dihydroorotate dehydrogenase electron transfer subunit
MTIPGGLGSSDRGLAPFGRRRCRVSENEPEGVYRLVGVEDPAGPLPLPGQFYMLAAVDDWGGGADARPYLARAFSVCRVRGSRLDFLVEDIGPGTHRLARLTPGRHEVWLVGPLGVGFALPTELTATGEMARALLVGGGAGVAPLVIWAETLPAAGCEDLALLGFRDAAHCDAARLFPGAIEVTTDDGSVGHKGFVTELLETELDRHPDNVVYACGPQPMLEAVRRICEARSVPAQLALEEAMACGFGACFGCVVHTRSGYLRICVDGPVMTASDLDESWLMRQ